MAPTQRRPTYSRRLPAPDTDFIRRGLELFNGWRRAPLLLSVRAAIASPPGARAFLEIAKRHLRCLGGQPLRIDSQVPVAGGLGLIDDGDHPDRPRPASRDWP